MNPALSVVHQAALRSGQHGHQVTGCLGQGQFPVWMISWDASEVSKLALQALIQATTQETAVLDPLPPPFLLQPLRTLPTVATVRLVPTRQSRVPIVPLLFQLPPSQPQVKQKQVTAALGQLHGKAA